MQNDTLKNRIVPWQEKGRWYHGVYDYAANALINEKTDQFIIDNSGGFTAAGTTMTMRLQNKNYRVLDSKFILSDDIVPSSAGILTYPGAFSVTVQSYCYPVIGVNATAGQTEFWLFITET